MIRSYLKIAIRNLKKNKLFSFINITGLATGMAVAMLIGLWVWDEVTFDQQYENYDRIGQVWQFVKFDAEKSSYNSMPVPLAEELRTKYPDFKAVSVATYNRTTVLATGDQKFSNTGMYTEPDFTKITTPKMLAGTREGLKDINSILLSSSLAKTLFGEENPMNQTVRLDNKADVKVTGIYEDFPVRSSFADVRFLAPWSLLTTFDDYAKRAQDRWDENSFQLFAELKEGANFKEVSAVIKDIRMKRENPPAYKPEFFVHPMKKWHLYNDFKNGVNTGGLIQLVRLFGIAGIFVLLLACINFMNLSTARSEKRAREVGIRKAIGSVKSQLVYQFFSESLLVSFVALLFCIFFVQLSLPFFNEIAGKKMSLPWANLFFWLFSLAFCLVTGLIAGSYPALYLSSFKPIKVLKGTFKAGRFASMPRKALVIFQFSVSVILIIGTMVVFRQVDHARDRPVGYNRSDLIEVGANTPELRGRYDALRTALLNTGAVYDVSQSMGSVTEDFGGTTDVGWKGKSPDMRPLLMSSRITHDYGNTIGWKIAEGRNFSRDFSTDTAAVILNKSAVKTMGFKNPLDEFVRLSGKNYKVVGVVDDIIKDDPFKPVKPTIFVLDYYSANVFNIKLSPQTGPHAALASIESVFRKHAPSAPFEYKFVDEKYATKFFNEERIGKLAGFFAALAILISCLGLFGLASFVAEQRTKEIGIRKVLGATILNVWRLLSKDFVLLVFISLLIASPVAYYFMHNWLQNYEYRVTISWWVFALAGIGAIVITLVTVSFQAIKAAIANPVKSLRTE